MPVILQVDSIASRLCEVVMGTAVLYSTSQKRATLLEELDRPTTQELGRAHPYLNLQLKPQLSDVMMAALTVSEAQLTTKMCQDSRTQKL